MSDKSVTCSTCDHHEEPGFCAWFRKDVSPAEPRECEAHSRTTEYLTRFAKRPKQRSKNA